MNERIAVIMIGSNTLSGAVGQRKGAGIEIQAYVSAPEADYIQYGHVRNVEKAAEDMKNIVNELGLKLKININKVYMGMCAFTFHSLQCDVERTFDYETTVTEDIMDGLRDAAISQCDPDMLCTDPIMNFCRLDGTNVAHPEGCTARKIKVRYTCMKARKNVWNNIHQAAEIAGLDVVDDLIIPIELGHYLTTQKQTGSTYALVEINNTASTVSVFDNGKPAFLSVLPLGSALLVSDLTTMGLTSEEAINLLRERGLSTMYSPIETYTCKNYKTIRMSEIHDCLDARFTEILANVNHQIKNSGVDVCGNVFFMGDVFNLNGALDALHKYKPFEKVGYLLVPGSDIAWETKDKASAHIKQMLAALLSNRTEQCCIVLQPLAGPKPTPVKEQQTVNTQTVISFDDMDHPTVPTRGHHGSKPTHGSRTGTKKGPKTAFAKFVKGFQTTLFAEEDTQNKPQEVSNNQQ